MTDTPQTSIDAYEEVLDAGDDVTLRRRVAAALADEPMTTNELVRRFDEGSNAIRPRVNELVRMGCVERDGKRRNPSGHMAYVHHLTPTGRRYVRGEVEPEPDPPVSELKTKVVEVSRAYLAGDVDRDILRLAVERHDDMRRRADPEWVPDGEVEL